MLRAFKRLVLRLTTPFLMLGALTIGLTATAQTISDIPPSWGFNPSGKYQPTFTGIFQTSPSETGGATEILTPIMQGDGGIFFGDLRVGNTSRANIFINAGIGIRHFLTPSLIGSTYIFYDYQNDYDNGGETGLSVGGELLAEYYEARINAQLPTSGTEVMPGTLNASNEPIQVIGNQLVELIDLYEVDSIPLWSVSGEIGVKIPTPNLFNMDLRVFGGGYFKTANNADKISGARGRVEASANDLFGVPGLKLTLAGGIAYDSQREGTEGAFEARLAVPLQAYWKQLDNPRYASLTPLERRMTEYVRRDLTIQNDQRARLISQDSEAVINPETGEAFGTVYFANATGGGDGTQGNPVDFDTAVSDSGVNGVVIVDGDAGNITTTSAIELVGGQTIIGPDSALRVERSDGTITTFTTPSGTTPTFSSTSTDQIIEMDDDNSIIGVNFYSETALRGIQASSSEDGFISNVQISIGQVASNSEVGIQFFNASGQFTVNNVLIQGLNEDFSVGVEIAASNTVDIDFTGFTAVDDIEATAIVVNDGIADVSFEDIRLSGFRTNSAGVTVGGSQVTVDIQGLDSPNSTSFTNPFTGVSTGPRAGFQDSLDIYGVRVQDGATVSVSNATVYAGESTSFNSAAVDIRTGPTVTISNSSFFVTNDTAEALYVQGVSGFESSIALSNSTFTSGGGTNAIFLDGAIDPVNVLAFEDVTVVDGSIRGTVVNFETSGGGPISGGDLQIGSSGSPVTGYGMYLDQVTGTINFDSIAVYNTGATDENAGVVLSYTPGNFTFTYDSFTGTTTGGAPRLCDNGVCTNTP